MSDVMQTDMDFVIKKESHAAALDAVKELVTAIEKGEVPVSEKWHLWVTMNEFLKTDTLNDALWMGWHCEALNDDNGDITAVNCHVGNLGDGELLFSTLAPWVEDGSFIQWSEDDGDGDVSRWIFENGKLDWKRKGRSKEMKLYLLTHEHHDRNRVPSEITGDLYMFRSKRNPSDFDMEEITKTLGILIDMKNLIGLRIQEIGEIPVI